MNADISSMTLKRGSSPDRVHARALEKMGRALRDWRTLIAQRTQAQLGDELGIARSTVALMEQGSDGVSIGTWIHAFARMGRLDDILAAVAARADVDAAVASQIAATVERKHSEAVAKRGAAR